MKHLKYAKDNIAKPVAFWNNVLWTDETKIDIFATPKEGMFGEKKGWSLCREKHLANFFLCPL